VSGWPTVCPSPNQSTHSGLSKGRHRPKAPGWIVDDVDHLHHRWPQHAVISHGVPLPPTAIDSCHKSVNTAHTQRPRLELYTTESTAGQSQQFELDKVICSWKTPAADCVAGLSYLQLAKADAPHGVLQRVCGCGVCSRSLASGGLVACVTHTTLLLSTAARSFRAA
jgi:hypothetical protein